jgi:hypothetical protein
MLELTVTSLLNDALKDRLLKQYLPDLKNPWTDVVKTINRQFLFNIINTKKPSFFPDNIRGLMQARKE